MPSSLTFPVNPDGTLGEYPTLRSESRPRGGHDDSDRIDFLNDEGKWEMLPRGKQNPKRPGFHSLDVSELKKGSIFRISRPVRLIDDSRAVRGRGEELVDGGFRPENPGPGALYCTVAGRSSEGDQISVLVYESLKSAEHAAEEEVSGRSRAWGNTTAQERTAAIDLAVDYALLGSK